MKLLSTSAKLEKSQNDQWLNYVMYLEPNYHKSICLGASKGCRASCLVNSGMMRMATQTNARIQRTKLYIDDHSAFIAKLYKEIDLAITKANKLGKRLAIRLNGTSDLDWSQVYKDHPSVQFYEYTKRADLARKLNTIDNVDITMSRNERTKTERIKMLTDQGVNVAVVFDDKRPMPTTFEGVQVIDGDKHDRRFEDKRGVIVGLKLKGTNAVKDLARQSGFAVCHASDAL
jgi:hypothetical protein